MTIPCERIRAGQVSADARPIAGLMVGDGRRARYLPEHFSDA